MRLDNTSFLHEYYKKNKYLLTDEEDDEELDSEEPKNFGDNHNTKLRSSHTINLEEKKNNSFTKDIKRASTINVESKPIAAGPIAKKPILPSNISDSHKAYYESVEKVTDFLLKIYELNETNGFFG